MKKLMIAALAVVSMVGAAQASKWYGFILDGFVSKYEKDSQVSADHYGYYTLYAMKQSDVRQAMGVGTAVTYEDVAEWLGKNFAQNKQAVIDNGEAHVASDHYAKGVYVFSGDSAAAPDPNNSLGDSIGVFLYDDGENFAYNVFSNGMIEDWDTEQMKWATDVFAFNADSGSSASGWQVGSVPEPTSGLLLLLGIAGLALRRRRA